MVGYSEVKHTSPSVAFLFARLGALVESSRSSEVGSGDLERGSSSNVGGEGVGVDTATFAPSHVPSSSHPPAPAVPRPFHALKEKCSLKIEVFSKFRDRF